ncbi:MAG: repeat-associated core domain protein [Proteobacteria bacterium]|nr:repeat-associated core domain protein [Pseudomonadota bacterium]
MSAVRSVRLCFIASGLFWSLGSPTSEACSLTFTSPERGSTVTSAAVGVSGTGSGTANPNDVGQVTATINGVVFFQQTGVFTGLVSFLGSGAASVTLQPGENVLAVQGSVGSCSASDSMTIHYVPPPQQAQKAAGDPTDCNGTNPVHGGSGNKYQQETDYVGGGPLPLQFTRHYNARFGERRMLGSRWRHSYDRQLAFAAGGHAYLIRPDGRAFHFALSGTEWKPDADVNDRRRGRQQ